MCANFTLSAKPTQWHRGTSPRARGTRSLIRCVANDARALIGHFSGKCRSSALGLTLRRVSDSESRSPPARGMIKTLSYVRLEASVQVTFPLDFGFKC